MTKNNIKKYLPPIIIDFYRILFSYLNFLTYPNKKLFIKNRSLKNSGSGKRAFLLATGPSIKDENLKQLAGEDCFTVSNFFLHEDINLINPKFHFFAPYHKPLILENYIEWLRQADKALPNDTKIFLGHTTQDLVTKYKLFPEREVYYLYLSNYFSTDITGPIMFPQTGPLMIIPVLIYMGYEKIYLLGCDHNVLRDFKKPAEHFYNKSLEVRKNSSDENAWDNIINELDTTKNIFVQYKNYKLILEENMEIINLSKDSWLDIFKILNLNNVLKK